MKLCLLASILAAPVAAFSPSILLRAAPARNAALFAGEGVPTVGIQFYDGRFESTVPNIRLTRARDGTNGVAYFTFDRPSMFDPKETVEETIQDAITAMRLVDEEGEIKTTDVSASFVNGQPVSLQVTHVMPTAEKWERFIRFMDRYAAASELGFDGGAAPAAGAPTSSDPNQPRTQAV